MQLTNIILLCCNNLQISSLFVFIWIRQKMYEESVKIQNMKHISLKQRYTRAFSRCFYYDINMKTESCARENDSSKFSYRSIYYDKKKKNHRCAYVILRSLRHHELIFLGRTFAESQVNFESLFISILKRRRPTVVAVIRNVASCYI